MGISVIITHFAPSEDEKRCRDLLLQTINSIRSQKVNFDVEIVVCDDGSAWSSKLIAKSEEIIELSRPAIQKNPILIDLDVDRYIYINSGNKYFRNKLLHRAFLSARYSKIVSLDDDHPFIYKNSLDRFNRYLDEYDYVRGRIIDPTGIPQLFSTGEVQGTTFGFKKGLYHQVGGFGKYILQGCGGEDDELTFKIYHELKTSYPHQKKACYAGEIVTKDLLSGRWVGNSFSPTIDRIENFKQKKDAINDLARKYFLQDNNLKRVDNSFRNKSLWMEFPSFLSWLSEIYYRPIYHWRMVPVRIRIKYARFKKFIYYYKNDRNELIKRFKNTFRFLEAK